MVKMEMDLPHLTTPVATAKSRVIFKRCATLVSGPEVDNKGKPYAKYVHEVEEEDKKQQQQHQQRQQYEQGSIAAAFNPWAYYNSARNNEPDFCKMTLLCPKARVEILKM
jgi:hypothetical protein